MLNFVRNNFKKWFGAYLWILLIVCVLSGIISGSIIGNSLSYRDDYSVIGGFIGLLVGTLIGIFAVIIGGGLIATFINIDDNIEILKTAIIKQNPIGLVVNANDKEKSFENNNETKGEIVVESDYLKNLGK
jgi:uncharacterized BrkB/YihY/UPF0761 family membrane protein